MRRSLASRNPGRTPGTRGALSEPSRWQREPFRLFFPLGVLLGWLGVGHWLLYALGATTTYSCLGHGLAQVEGFLPAFALGFLLTALPRRTQGAPPSPALISACALGVTVAAAAAVTEHEAVAQVAFIAVIVLLVAFAARRFATRASGRRPPANFVLIPIGLLHGLAGAVLILVATLGEGVAWTLGLGRLFVQQGLFLCLVVGVAGLLVPLMSGAPPPRISTPRRKSGGAPSGGRCWVLQCSPPSCSNGRDGSISGRSPAPRWSRTGSAGAAHSGS